jgi:hypothetical protein
MRWGFFPAEAPRRKVFLIFLCGLAPLRENLWIKLPWSQESFCLCVQEERVAGTSTILTTPASSAGSHGHNVATADPSPIHLSQSCLPRRTDYGDRRFFGTGEGKATEVTSTGKVF